MARTGLDLRRVRGTVFSIGIYEGASPLALAPARGDHPVLSRDDVDDRFATLVADPFMVEVDGTWYMFFEVLTWTWQGKRGEIGLATSQDGLRWTYRGIVLSEPFHLSYPQVLAWNGEMYLVPESTAASAVRLYRATAFPVRWTCVGTLLSGSTFLDSSVFHHEGRWWMLTEASARGGTLRLFHAADLAGPWTEHPASPVVRGDPRRARPAGRVVVDGGRLLRFAQDCHRIYGESVRALEITRLTPRDYAEVEIAPAPVLAGSGAGWNRDGMHHVDAHRRPDGRWLACVDGWAERLRRPGELARWAVSSGAALAGRAAQRAAIQHR